MGDVQYINSISLFKCSLYFSILLYFSEELYSSEATLAKCYFSKRKWVIRSMERFLINFASKLAILWRLSLLYKSKMAQYQNFMHELWSEVETKEGFESNLKPHYNHMVPRHSPSHLVFPTRPKFESFFTLVIQRPVLWRREQHIPQDMQLSSVCCCFLASSTRGDRSFQ